MANARTATLTGTARWSNGVLFDGYVLIALALPTGYSSAAPAGQWPDMALPKLIKIPITGGAFNPAVQLYWNGDLEPPSCRYCAYWYDTQDTLISGPSSLFDVTASPFTPSIPTLNPPAAATATPAPATSPDAGVSSGGSSIAVASFAEEIPAGAINGSNATFTLTNAPQRLWLFRNGVRQAAPGDYTLTAATLTLTTAPLADDTLWASYWWTASGVPAVTTPPDVEEAPSGSRDGANATFTLSYAPRHLMLFANGVRQVATTDYSLAGSVITMNNPPAATDTLWATYWT